MSHHTICEIQEGLLQKIDEYRFAQSKELSAMILKIDKENLLIELEDHLTETTFEEIADELPEMSPRYIILNYEHKKPDGRVSYPFIFVYYSPAGTKMDLHMLYASCKMDISTKAKITKQFELTDAEDFTSEWLEKQLEFYK